MYTAGAEEDLTSLYIHWMHTHVAEDVKLLQSTLWPCQDRSQVVSTSCTKDTLVHSEVLEGGDEGNKGVDGEVRTG